jgi:hypothetical protein
VFASPPVQFARLTGIVMDAAELSQGLRADFLRQSPNVDVTVP